MRNQFEPAKLPTFEPLKPLTLPNLNQPETQSVSKKQSLQDIHMAGGGVPAQYKGREHVWHAKVNKHEVSMKKGGDPLDEFVPPRFRSAGRRPESQNDRTAAANMPVDFARGAISGALGAPGDIESLVRMLPGFDEKTFLPTSEDIEKRLPFRSDTPQGRMASGLGSLAGGFYTGPGSPFNVAGKAAKLAGEGMGALKGSGAGTKGLAGQRGVVKMPGGNWLTGRVEKDVKGLKRHVPEEGEIENINRVAGQDVRPQRQADIALNKWVDSNLSNYIKKQMGTPEDPVRALAEQGITHKKELDPALNYAGLREQREKAGFPAEGMGQSPLAKAWEQAADEAIATHRAGDIQEMPNKFIKGEEAKAKMVAARDELDKKFMKRLEDAGMNDNEVASLMSRTPYIDKAQIIGDTAFSQANADYVAQHSPMMSSYLELGRQNPWISKVDPETPIHSSFTGGLGFDHIMDVLREDLTAGRIRPEQMNKISISDAVRRTHAYDEDMAKKMAEAQAKVTEGMPVHKEYPEGYKWIELTQPKADPSRPLPEGYHYETEKDGSVVVDSRTGEVASPELAAALKYEGDTMGHCVGGYCPDVLEGRSRIYSLRDAKGEPHVTVEVQPVRGSELGRMMGDLSDEEAAAIYKNPPQRIKQIKGKQNRAPKEEYLPYVQDFVKSGQWSDVGDLQNTKLRRTSDAFNENEIKKIQAAGIEVPTWATPDEIKAIGDKVWPGQYGTPPGGIPPESMAHGGEVHMAGGGLLKSGLKKLAQFAEDVPKGIKPIVVRTPEERAVLEKFGQKQEQEAVRAKKVEKAARTAAAEPEAQAKPVKSTGRREKVAPDVYRKMAAELGDEAVLKAARAGEHLKPTASGYTGFPRTVTSPQGLGAMRRAIDQDFIDSVEAVRLADPERLGTWYDRAKKGIAESVEPYQLPRTLEQHGVYSAGVSPESELGFALKHLNSRVAGEPGMAYRGAPMRTLDTAVAGDRPAKMGFKIGEYAEKNDPRVANAGLFGVNDFRRAQGMGYTDPQGKPWKAGVSETMHPVMDAETALQVERANVAGIGGRSDWAGPHIQEVPWVYGKAQDLYGRGKRGRYGGDELEGIKSAIQDANNTARDYMYKHAASATHEAIPGASLGHVRQALDMTPEEKVAYGQRGRWDQPAPEAALNELPEVGAGNRDIIYGAAGYRQLPSREASGLYINKLGGVETNPMTIARPLMDYPTGGGGLMAPESRKMMDTAEQFRALIDAQEAGAYNLPNTMADVKGKTSMVMDTRAMNPDQLADPTAGVLPTSEQLAKMSDVMGEYGYGVTSTNRGAVAFPFDPSIDSAEASKAMRKGSKALQEIYPSSQQKSMTTTGYVPGVGKRSAEGPLSTAPFSGEATSDMLKAFSEMHPSVSQNLSESEAIRAAIREKALRDSLMGGTRKDIQETRRFFSEADWPKAVEMIRRGITPAAALAALGYSASSMAGEKK